MQHFCYRAKAQISLLNSLLFCALLFWCTMVPAQTRLLAPLELIDQKGVVSLTAMLQTFMDTSGKLDVDQVAQSSESVFKPCLLATLVTVGIAMLEGDRNARWLALGFMPTVLTTLSPLLRNFGVSATDFPTEYGRMLGSLVELPILFCGLLRRVTLRRQPGMRATGLRSMDPLTGVHSAPMLLRKLQQVLQTTGRYRQPFALLLIDVFNLPALQKKYNREVADRALVMAAARIRFVAGMTDTVAPVGEAQFALLIDGFVSIDSATDAATQLLAAGLRATNELPEREPLRFHITLGHHSVSRTSQLAPAEAMLTQLLLALKEMNDSSGKAIQVMKI